MLGQYRALQSSLLEGGVSLDKLLHTPSDQSWAKRIHSHIYLSFTFYTTGVDLKVESTHISVFIHNLHYTSRVEYEMNTEMYTAPVWILLTPPEDSLDVMDIQMNDRLPSPGKHSHKCNTYLSTSALQCKQMAEAGRFDSNIQEWNDP